MKLESLFGVLHGNGYDDMDFLLAQVRSSEPLTLAILEQIGVDKSGYRVKLLALLEEEAFKNMRSSMPISSHTICSTSPTKFPTLEKWLESINLAHLYSNFYNNGYEDMNSLVTIMQSNYALTDESLNSNLGITDCESREKILKKFKMELGITIQHKRVISRVLIEKDEPIVACEFCLVF